MRSMFVTMKLNHAALPILVLTLAVLASPAVAQTNLARQVQACAQIETEQERLECYDTVFRLSAADGVTDDGGESVREGDADPSEASPSAGASGERPVTVVDVRLRPPLPAIFTTEDGQVWVQTDSRRIDHMDSPPFPARLQPGAVGSWFLAPDSGIRRVRVRLQR